MRDEDQPPPGAVPLSEALNPQLLDALRQAEERLAAAQAAVPPQPSWVERSWGGRFDEALEAWKHCPAVRAAAAAQDEVNRAWRAAADDRQARLINGEWLAWGREGSSVGPRRLLPAEAWRYFRFRRDDVVEVPGPPPIMFYGVVVAPTQREEMAAPALTSTIAAVDRCRKWLVDLMVDGKAKSGAKRDYASEARERFQVSQRAFARAWDAAIQETGNTAWSKPGRKSKS